MRDDKRTPVGGIGEPDPADLARLIAASEKLVHTQFTTLRELGIERPTVDLPAGVLLRQLDQIEIHLGRLRRMLGESVPAAPPGPMTGPGGPRDLKRR
ncbi:hypothetical protein AB0M36_10500 [Actinoplanes sp. NPDC051346]|uniref:hypothetical protein n=1 Tax=Actinoplanes sp. NPDC051346 TaxID=3155048 RepID=UPI0034419DEB